MYAMYKKLFVLMLIFSLFAFKTETLVLKIGKKAPNTSKKMKDVSGKEFSLDDIKGTKGTIVVFSCNTCPFVVGNDDFGGWEKQYNDLYGFAKNSGFGMVLINSNAAKRDEDDSWQKMKDHSDKQNYKMKYLMDNDSELADAFGAKTTPHVYLLDQDMKLVYQGAIDNSYNNKAEQIPYLRNAISYLIKGQKITTNTIAPVGCSIKRVK